MKTALRTPNEYWLLGFCAAVSVHLVLAALVIFRLGAASKDFLRPIVYSVSIEGGKALGGRTQVPDKDKATPLAPPKNVSTPEPTRDALSAKVDDAEISLAKKTPTPTPRPSPKASPKAGIQKGGEKDKPKTPKPTPMKKVEAPDPDKEYQRAMQRYLGESADAGGKGFGAAALGGKGMGGGVLASPEFIAYLGLLKSHVHKGWRWYDRGAHYRARVYFRIEPNGAVKDVRMVDSSGSREFDDSVLRALAKADPVPAPPEKVYSAFKEVRMIFDPQELE